MSTKFLTEHAENLARFASQTTARSKAAPDDFFLELAAKNQLEAYQHVNRELALALAEEAGELLDLRFIGPKADGSILLDTFIKIAEPLSKAWKYAAHRLRSGNDSIRIDQEIGSVLNLKLAGMSYGSTRIFLTGNGQPDLTGESLLQETLIQTFNLLTATNEDFYDAVDAVGGRAAHLFGEAMKAIDTAGLAAEFTWQSPKERFIWHGRSDEIVRLRKLLDGVKEPEQYPEKITGFIAGISDTGRLDVRTNDGKITIRFPLKLTDRVQRLSIAKPATISVLTARYWDAVGKRDIYKRQMIDLVE